MTNKAETERERVRDWKEKIDALQEDGKFQESKMNHFAFDLLIRNKKAIEIYKVLHKGHLYRYILEMNV